MISISATTALCATDSAFPDLSPSADTPLSSEGYFVISWNLGDLPQAVLQQSASGSFSAPVEREVGPEGSITITGLPDGEYFFRLGNGHSWGDSIRVTVEHHALGRAIRFFTAGLLLFVILVLTIVIGNRNTRELS